MFRIERRDTAAGRAVRLGELVFHATVRQIRKGHGNGMQALAMNVLQSAIFIGAFVALFGFLGIRGAAIRGNFVLYIMSGVFLFMTHIKALNAVVAAEGPASPIMKHAPMNTAISILAAALSSLYIQVLSAGIILLGVDVLWERIDIYDLRGFALMFGLSWFVGVAIGVILFAAKPWAPNVVTILASVYSRVNMIASGKMFVVNTMPATLRGFFDWNPLFHTIDQSRGFAFINYNPHYTQWDYALKVGLVCLVVGMMAEFYTRRHASASWFAAR